ncbi:MAG: CUB domain-containing protein [Bacteroidia bacterium]|nr:CUB domain-containing protein [Bacteroidia bacterium]
MKYLQGFLISVFAMLLLIQPVLAQRNPYAAFFEEAYQKYPSVPRGFLEAVAYTNTRMNHVTPDVGCMDQPTYYGVMGLVGDGKGYFQNSLQRVAELSGYPVAEIINDPRTNILAYAAAYAIVQQNKRMTTRSVDGHKTLMADLSEIPQDGSLHNQFALDQQFYSVLVEMQNPHTGTANRTRQVFNFEEIFGRDTYRILSADRVQISGQRVRSVNGEELKPAAGTHQTTCSATNQAPDFPGAIWNAANSRNYGSREGEVQFVTIHTIQGSYASAISWFKNPNARVSAHYIIRASDGQITQMVCEDDKAYHVRTDNDAAIGIEHEGFIADGASWYSNEMYESSAALVRDICRRHGIDPLKCFGGPPTNGTRTLSNACYLVKGHQHFRGNNHIDPGPFWDWDRYYRLINGTPAPVRYTAQAGDVYDTGKATGNYGDQERVTYLIKPDGATSVSLVFKAMDLEGTKETPYDYLDIYDGENTSGRYLGRFTGTQLPGPLRAASGAVFMEFRSDCQINKAGWHIAYSADNSSNACGNPSQLLAGDIFPMGATLTWQDSGTPAEYLVRVTRKLDNSVLLYKTRERSIVLTGLASNALYQWQVQGICGRDSSAVAGSSFITSNIMNGVSQVFTVRELTGKLYDSGGLLAGYANNENYQFCIVPANGGRVEVKFTAFDTEPEVDQLIVYDGIGTNGTRLGTYSGKTLPKTLTSTGNGLTLHFISNSRTNAPGWAATWRTLGGTSGGSSPVVVTPGGGGSGSSGNSGGSTPPQPPVISGDFDPGISYPANAPETSPVLAASLAGSFQLAFQDQTRDGASIANRFYCIAREAGNGWVTNPRAGFLLDDFEAGLRSGWKQATGTWQVTQGRLTQTNVQHENTNLYTDLRQTNKDVFLYHWKAAMTGGANSRHGLHFFASQPANTERGISYFVLIRDAAGQDYVEIYKTVNDQFDRKVRKAVTFQTGKVYDYKVICNAAKGKIEVYVNDVFTTSWTDPYPLFAGAAVSLRTGNCALTLDDFTVYKAREGSVAVTAATTSLADLEAAGRFQVRSLVVDQNLHWSRVSTAYGVLTSLVAGGGGTSSGGGGTSGGGSGSPDPTPAPNTGSLSVSFGEGGSGTGYYLPVDYDGQQWGANTDLGFLYEECNRSNLGDWKAVSGEWQMRDGVLRQTNIAEANGNIWIPLRQDADHVYLYHWRARLTHDMENNRFGIHFFASDGALSNRGNSYLIWFRNQLAAPDRIEIYRAANNALPKFDEAVNINLPAGTWVDCKVLYHPATGQVEAYLNQVRVLNWTDKQAPLGSGAAFSLRTGNSDVQFDDIRVYQLRRSDPVILSAGQASDPIRHKGNVRIFSIIRDGSGRWNEVKEVKREVK